MSDQQQQQQNAASRRPWWLNRTDIRVFFNPKVADTFICRVWVITGWRWASWLLCRGIKGAPLAVRAQKDKI